MNWKIEFSKGERNGIVAITILDIVCFLFGRFYENLSAKEYDLTAFETEVRLFEEEQARLADSAKRVNDSIKNCYRGGYGNKCASGWRVPPDTGFSARQKRQYYEIVKLDINSCDTSDLLAVPLFGSKRAAKLVEYREKLGGFYDLNQVMEVYVLQGMSLEHLEKYFYIDHARIRKIHINSATYQMLVSHPYFDSYLTKMVLNYRNKNGKIGSMEEFKKCTNAYDVLVQKLRPYLVFDD